jgi:hypothetical protein
MTGFAGIPRICRFSAALVRRAVRSRRRREPPAGQVHRLATLATILADQGDADGAASIAGQMLDRATGLESCRIQCRVRLRLPGLA